MTAQSFEIEDISILNDNPFATVQESLQPTAGRFDESIFERLGAGDIEEGLAAMRALAPLVIVGGRDHRIMLKRGTTGRGGRLDT